MAQHAKIAECLVRLLSSLATQVGDMLTVLQIVHIFYFPFTLCCATAIFATLFVDDYGSSANFIKTISVRLFMSEFAHEVASRLNIKPQQVTAVVNLFDEGATIPFIARYRKDKTGNLDEVVIQQIQEETRLLKDLADRKAFVLKAINEQGKMTDDIEAKLNAADNISVVEDIYLPYKPKRKTKAQTARENGLEPLAHTAVQQNDIDVKAKRQFY